MILNAAFNNHNSGSFWITEQMGCGSLKSGLMPMVLTLKFSNTEYLKSLDFYACMYPGPGGMDISCLPYWTGYKTMLTNAQGQRMGHHYKITSGHLLKVTFNNLWKVETYSKRSVLRAIRMMWGKLAAHKGHKSCHQLHQYSLQRGSALFWKVSRNKVKVSPECRGKRAGAKQPAKNKPEISAVACLLTEWEPVTDILFAIKGFSWVPRHEFFKQL